MAVDSTNDIVRILMVDDDPDWCTTLRLMSEALGYEFESVSTPEEVQIKLVNADNEGQSFSVAAVDMNFITGKTKIEAARGKEIIRYIKKHHPHVACLVITGIDLSADHVLDLRDDYDLDYYLQKDRIDLDTYSKAIQKAQNRAQMYRKPGFQLALLKDALQKWRSVYANGVKNLAYAKEREAMKGIDVDVATRNEITLYTERVAEAEKQIANIQKEIDGFQENPGA